MSAVNSLHDLAARLDSPVVGKEMHGFMAELYPVCRSITGDGLRQTLRRISARVPLTVHEVASGTPVFDWTVPKEWNIRDAYVKDAKGRRVIDFQKHNLHVLNYSVPVHQNMSLVELKKHIFTLPEHPDWIPYRTSYYAERWGFCLSHNALGKLPDGEYEVCIDSALEPGHLSYGELVLKGQTDEEILISCHSCHPSLANDNLSGIALATFAAQLLARTHLRHSYRFLFIPGTIGSITWLARNEDKVSRIRHGLVVTCVGDAGGFTYKKSRRGDAGVDRAADHVLRHTGKAYTILDFAPYGYDERQYGSPGFNLPVGCFMRTPNGRYPEYHTSADNLDFVKPESLGESLATLLKIFAVWEGNRRFLNQNPRCEPQLGKRGLYGPVGGAADARAHEMAMLWVLNMSDGEHDLLEIADRSKMSFDQIESAALKLLNAGLIRPCANGASEKRPS